MHFPATRTAALEKLNKFVPKSGRDYAAGRNFDLPDQDHPHVSKLSPYLRHRILTEHETLEAVLGRYALSSAEKFIQEVYWRTYWKGWLELRPALWRDYRSDVKGALNRVQTEAGLRAEFDAACAGETEIECFNAWAQELVETGYLHNHARMWFASIWVFTLRLPWALGADFFLRHLLDGDPASNTLSWRWVAGMQTKGKTYLARASNIEKYTEGRHRPAPYQLASEAVALDSPPHPAIGPMPICGTWERGQDTALLLTEDDLSPGFLFAQGLTPSHTATLLTHGDRSPLVISPNVATFTQKAAADTLDRFKDKTGPTAAFEGAQSIPDVVAWAQTTGATQIVTPYAPTGPAQEALDQLEYRLKPHNISLVRVLRDYDRAAWPYATHGFFKFKEKIPKLVGAIKGVKTVA